MKVNCVVFLINLYYVFHPHNYSYASQISESYIDEVNYLIYKTSERIEEKRMNKCLHY